MGYVKRTMKKSQKCPPTMKFRLRSRSRRCKAKSNQSLAEVKFQSPLPRKPQGEAAVAGLLPSGQGWRLRNKPDGPRLKGPGQGAPNQPKGARGDEVKIGTHIIRLHLLRPLGRLAEHAPANQSLQFFPCRHRPRSS